MVLDPGLIHVEDIAFFTQREALPVVRHQDPLEIRVASELDTEHIEDLTFKPVSGQVDVADSLRVKGFRKASFDAHAAIVRERVKDCDQFKARFVFRVIDGGEVAQIVEGMIVAKKCDNSVEFVRRSFGEWLTAEGLRFQDRLNKFGVEMAGKAVFPSFRGHNRNRFGFLRHDETFRFAQFCVEI